MFSRFTSMPFIICLLCLAFVSTSQAAKIYRWVDENGMAHYSQNPPRELQSETVNIRAASKGTPSSSHVKTEASSQEKTATKEKESLTAEHSPEDKAKYCQQSKNLLQQMNGNTNRRFAQDDGSFRKLSQEEIADYRNKAQKGISDYCQ